MRWRPHATLFSFPNFLTEGQKFGTGRSASILPEATPAFGSSTPPEQSVPRDMCHVGTDGRNQA
jgi:hypothetical protein